MTKPAPSAPTAALLQVIADRGLTLLRVASVYHLANLLILAPFTALLGSGALAARGTPAVVNDALVGLLTSPTTLALLFVSALASLSMSRLASGASSYVVVDGSEAAVGSIGWAWRNLGGLLGIVGWALLWTAALSLPIVALGLAAYVARFGMLSPVAAYARDLPALIWIGTSLGVALGVLWTWLFLRWCVATPAFAADAAVTARDALKRSAELTRGRRLRLLVVLIAVQIPIGILFTIVASIVRGVGGWLVGLTDSAWWVLALVLALWAITRFATDVMSSVAYEAVVTSRFLAADGRPLSPAEMRPSRPGRVFVLGAIIVTIIAAIGASQAVQILRQPIDLSKVEIIAHRAGAIEAPENSVSAVKIAREQGADRLEFDVQRTKDGQLVVIHDADTLRITGVDLSVKDSTLKELQRLDISGGNPKHKGERIPTLEDFIAAAGPTPLALEIKSKGADGIETIKGVVEQLQLDSAVPRTVLISLENSQLDIAKGMLPSLKVGQLVAVTEGDPALLPVDVVAPESGIAPSPFVFAAHASGKKVWVWTIDDEELVRVSALRGVDGIITNDVPKAKRALEQLGTVTTADVAKQRLSDLLE